MNVVVLAGHLSGPPRLTELPSGDQRWALDLSCRSDPASPVPAASVAGESVTLSVPVAVNAPIAGIERFEAGAELVVAGVIRRRFYRTGGRTESRTEVIAQAVVPVTARRNRDRALVTAMRVVGAEQAATLREALPAT